MSLELIISVWEIYLATSFIADTCFGEHKSFYNHNLCTNKNNHRCIRDNSIQYGDAYYNGIFCKFIINMLPLVYQIFKSKIRMLNSVKD